MTPLLWLAVVLAAAALLCWPASWLLERVRDRRRSTARARVDAWLEAQQRDRDSAERDARPVDPTAALPATVEDADGARVRRVYPPTLDQPSARPVDAPTLDDPTAEVRRPSLERSIAAHPAKGRPLAQVVPFSPTRAPRRPA